MLNLLVFFPTNLNTSIPLVWKLELCATFLLRTMGWLPIEKLLNHATVKLAHQIMQTSIPEVLSYKIKNKISISKNITRLMGPGKFGPRPK